jgi:hypothetical protein
MQNDDFPEPLGPATIHENGCLNRKSWFMTGVTTSKRSLIYQYRTDVLSPSLRLLKKEILYILSYDSVIISIQPPTLLRLILCSAWTVTRSESFPLNTISRMTSKLTSLEAPLFSVIPRTLHTVSRSPVAD